MNVYTKPKAISEKMAATMTLSWLDGLVTKAFMSKNDDYKAIASHLYEIGAIDKLVDASFNNEKTPFNSIVKFCKEALFYAHIDEISATYDHRFSWPTYEYIANPELIDEE